MRFKPNDRVIWGWEDGAPAYGTVIVVSSTGEVDIQCDDGGCITVKDSDPTVTKVAQKR